MEFNGPTAKIELRLHPLRRQLDRHCSHGRTIVHVAGGGHIEFVCRGDGRIGVFRREFRACRFGWLRVKFRQAVRLPLDNLPPTLAKERETLARCLEAMDRVLPLTAVYLFGSHARGEVRPDSDVDLCLVSVGASHQLKAAQSFRRAMRSIRPKPAFTLVPISPARLEEKKASGDHFFATVLREGVLLATQN